MLMAAAGLGETGLTWGLLVAALVFGLRHGVDWDHIAAISDITAASTGARGLRLGMWYAIGHGVVVFVLGVLALVLGSRLPPSIDDLMGRVAGVTLLALAAAVMFSLVHERGQFRMRSRWLLLIVVVRRALRRAIGLVRSNREPIHHAHDHVTIDGFHHDGDAGHPADGDNGTRLRAPLAGHPHEHSHPGEEYTTGFTVGIGMLHGVGAETPTQVVIFLAAAHAGGALTGLIVLAVFLAGLFASNLAITLVGVTGFGSTTPRPRVHVALALATTVVSVIVGLALLLDNGGALPTLPV